MSARSRWLLTIASVFGLCLMFGGGSGSPKAGRSKRLPLELSPSLWRVSYEDRGSSASSLNAVTVSLELKASLRLGPTQQNRVPAQLQILSLQTNLTDQALVSLRSQLERPIVFDTSSGHLLLTEHHLELEGPAQMILNRLKIAFFIPLAECPSDSWQSTTYDWASPLTFDHQISEDLSGSRLSSKVIGNTSAGTSTRQLEGTRLLMFDGPRHLLQHITLSLSERWGSPSFPLAKNQILLSAQRSAEPMPTPSVPVLAKASSTALKAPSAKSASDADLNQMDLARNSLQAQTLAEIHAALSSYIQMKKRQDLLSPDLYTKLRAILFLQPESAQTLAELTLQVEPHDGLFQGITAALAAIGNPACQQALLSLIERADKPSQRADQLLIAIAAVEKPGAASISSLQELSQGPEAHTAQMADAAIGSLGHRAIRENYGQVRELHSFLLEKLHKAKEPKAQAIALSNLGNLGANEQLATVLPYLKTAELDLRTSAIYSLRWVHTEAAQEQLIAILKQTQSATDARVAARALFFQAPTEAIILAQRQILDSTKDEALALQILHNFSRLLTFDPSLKASLNWQAEHGLSPKVMDRAKEILWSHQEIP